MNIRNLKNNKRCPICGLNPFCKHGVGKNETQNESLPFGPHCMRRVQGGESV